MELDGILTDRNISWHLATVARATKRRRDISTKTFRPGPSDSAATSCRPWRSRFTRRTSSKTTPSFRTLPSRSASTTVATMTAFTSTLTARDFATLSRFEDLFRFAIFLNTRWFLSKVADVVTKNSDLCIGLLICFWSFKQHYCCSSEGVIAWCPLIHGAADISLESVSGIGRKVVITLLLLLLISWHKM